MSLSIRGLHFKVADFVGPNNFSDGTSKMKLAIWAVLYCRG